jgi:hypothetical protein
LRLSRLGFGLLAVVVLVSSSSAGGRNALGFVLELAPSQNGTQPGVANWKVGAPVFVLVMMINNTSRTIHYSLRNSAFDYEMDVRDASGRPVPESESFRKLKEQVKNSPVHGRNILVTLRPGETGQDAVGVNGLYDLSSPGQYSIQMRREVPDVGKGFVQSNRLELTVTL